MPGQLVRREEGEFALVAFEIFVTGPLVFDEIYPRCGFIGAKFTIPRDFVGCFHVFCQDIHSVSIKPAGLAVIFCVFYFTSSLLIKVRCKHGGAIRGQKVER